MQNLSNKALQVISPVSEILILASEQLLWLQIRTLTRRLPGGWFWAKDAFQQQCSTNMLPSQALSGVFWSRRSFLSITDIVIDVVHSLVMVVVLWYVNVHLCPPPFVTLTVSFAHSVDLLKKTREALIRCEAQFTGPVFISIIQSNPLSDQWSSLCLGKFHYNFHNVHGMTDFFIAF